MKAYDLTKYRPLVNGWDELRIGDQYTREELDFTDNENWLTFGDSGLTEATENLNFVPRMAYRRPL